MDHGLRNHAASKRPLCGPDTQVRLGGDGGGAGNVTLGDGIRRSDPTIASRHTTELLRATTEILNHERTMLTPDEFNIAHVGSLPTISAVYNISPIAYAYTRRIQYRTRWITSNYFGLFARGPASYVPA